MWSAIQEHRAALANSWRSYSEKWYCLRRRENACARSTFLVRGMARAARPGQDQCASLSCADWLLPSLALYRHRVVSRWARSGFSLIQSSCRGNSIRKVGVFARFTPLLLLMTRRGSKSEALCRPVCTRRPALGTSFPRRCVRRTCFLSKQKMEGIERQSSR